MTPSEVCVKSAEMEFCSLGIGLCLKDKKSFIAHVACRPFIKHFN